MRRGGAAFQKHAVLPSLVGRRVRDSRRSRQRDRPDYFRLSQRAAGRARLRRLGRAVVHSDRAMENGALPLGSFSHAKKGVVNG
jgi:hypothetical protein